MMVIFFVVYFLSFGVGVFSLMNVNKMQKYFVYIVAFQTYSILIMNILGTFIWK